MILVTGGAGFIGSGFVHEWLASGDEPLVNLDALTYAGTLANLETVAGDPRYRFVEGDIRDGELVSRLLAEHRVRAIVHFAAESHVDRSIHGPEAFVQTNVIGTFRLLEAARGHWNTLPAGAREAFRFILVSTDEVFGTLEPHDPPFVETCPYRPNSPYAASKAAGDHLVRSYFHTYGLPTITTNGSNTFGPRQYPEKLIPLCLTRALAGEPLPIYGDGRQVRDWLYVADHCRGVMRALAVGRPGETYAIGGGNELVNIDTIQILCRILDEERPRAGGARYAELITHVTDRPGHDRRYALDSRKAHEQLGWRPTESFSTALRETVRWYLANPGWLEHVGRRSRGG